MTLNDLERQNRWFYGFFWRFQAATQVCIVHKKAPQYYYYVGNFFGIILTLVICNRHTSCTKILSEE